MGGGFFPGQVKWIDHAITEWLDGEYHQDLQEEIAAQAAEKTYKAQVEALEKQQLKEQAADNRKILAEAKRFEKQLIAARKRLLDAEERQRISDEKKQCRILAALEHKQNLALEQLRVAEIKKQTKAQEIERQANLSPEQRKQEALERKRAKDLMAYENAAQKAEELAIRAARIKAIDEARAAQVVQDAEDKRNRKEIIEGNKQRAHVNRIARDRRTSEKLGERSRDQMVLSLFLGGGGAMGSQPSLPEENHPVISSSDLSSSLELDSELSVRDSRME
ncbi:hypothetical protein PtA15_8A157 [Puccinia triticina]|uniref:Uncharacterized protein n=1 Tax=Puccinia triticina TaxID=208348 RepID=A0ABY7CSD0_9BASI|nr:uncharacterized protein PtA15_8A157 [Puccinia triticina]WAQ87253.1 hypothetical protein PtA15_8A157 [Puccinia triticina]